MQFVLLIYQGTTPIPNTEEWKTLPDEEKKRIYTDYEALNKTPGVAPGPPLGLPKDATTVRVQNGKTLSNGKRVTRELFREMLTEELQVVRGEVGESRFEDGRFRQAAELMNQLTTADELTDFLTLPAYEMLG